MAASYGKFSELHIERVWALTLAGHSGRKITQFLAKGFPRESPPVPPLKVSEQAVNNLRKRLAEDWKALESIKLATVPTQANADALRARILRIANREAERLAMLQTVGKLDADDLRKLANAAKAVESMEDAATKRGSKRPVGRPPTPQSTTPEPVQSVVGSLLRKGNGSGVDPPQSAAASGSAPVVP